MTETVAHSVSPEQVQAIARAAFTVATTDGTTPLSPASRTGISSVLGSIFGHDLQGAPDALTTITSGELVRAVEDERIRLDLVRVLAVLALLDGVVEKRKLELVVDVATALHVHAEFVDAIHQLCIDHLRWAGFDMIRAKVATIPGAVDELAEAWATPHDSLHVLSG